MFGLFKKKIQSQTETQQTPGKPDKPSNSFIKKISQFFRQTEKDTDKLLADIETTLILADTGIEATGLIVNQLKHYLRQHKNPQPEQVLQALKSMLISMMQKAEQPLYIPLRNSPLQNDSSDLPFVILVIGVNGVGKTTTIAKLAKRLQREGKKVMLAAGDTFRAGAIEQLSLWAERHKIPIIAQEQHADSAAVIYDCLTSAIARKMDVVIADTAGRLHNREDLMRELDKVIRVMRKINKHVPQEILLVLDATTGQNAINQLETFNKLAQITGIVLTKYDGTAKGGILLHLAQTQAVPVKLVGTGEGIDDLVDFNSQAFVDGLFIDAGLPGSDFTQVKE